MPAPLYGASTDAASLARGASFKDLSVFKDGEVARRAVRDRGFSVQSQYALDYIEAQ